MPSDQEFFFATFTTETNISSEEDVRWCDISSSREGPNIEPHRLLEQPNKIGFIDVVVVILQAHYIYIFH